jgi:hypothetical protein
MSMCMALARRPGPPAMSLDAVRLAKAFHHVDPLERF